MTTTVVDIGEYEAVPTHEAALAGIDASMRTRRLADERIGELVSQDVRFFVGYSVGSDGRKERPIPNSGNSISVSTMVRALSNALT